MFRRRPLARAAVVGGAAYYAGKKGGQSAQNPAVEQQATAEQQAAAEQEAAPVPAAPPADKSMEELAKLKELLDTGVLTQAEFRAEKQKILQTM